VCCLPLRRHISDGLEKFAFKNGTENAWVNAGGQWKASPHVVNRDPPVSLSYSDSQGSCLSKETRLVPLEMAMSLVPLGAGLGEVKQIRCHRIGSMKIAEHEWSTAHPIKSAA